MVWLYLLIILLKDGEKIFGSFVFKPATGKVVQEASDGEMIGFSHFLDPISNL